jgi:Transglycosylase SLT domain
MPMPRSFRLLLLALGAVVLPDSVAGADPVRGAERPTTLVETICPLMEKEARLNGLSPAFFVRLIWRESAFRPNAVSHKGAQGIAQFMPATARERGLENAFDPALAIPHSARLLADHARVFGNFGLAAAAYNAGPERVRAWLEGTRTLPAETQAYVHFITGHPADRWKDAGAVPAATGETTSAALQQSCRNRAPARVHVALPAARIASRGSSPWGVQLATNFSQTTVAAAFEGLKRRHTTLLANSEPMFVAERNLSRGRRPMVALRVGAETRDAALQLCQRLRAEGGVCTVEKN